MDILDTLSSAMGPSEADAASAPANPQDQQTQWVQKFLLQHLIAQKFGEQKAQAAQTQHQADPVYQAKVQQAQQKMAPQPSIAQLISGGAGQPSQPQAPDTIFQGSTPGTGTPFFSNRPEAIGQMFGPEAQAGFEAKRASVQPPPTAPGASGAQGGPNPQLVQKHAMIVQQLTKMGYSPTQAGGIADMAVPEIGQVAKQSKRSDAQLAAGEKPLEKAASSFINQDTGERAKPSMTHADMTSPNSPWLALDTDQEKVWDGLNTMKAHILGTEQYLNELPNKGSMWRSRPVNQFIMFLRKQTDERAQALADQMDNLTPIALSRTFAAGGRGGPTLATMIRKGGVNSGDTVEMAMEKLKNLKGMGFQLAKDNGLPTKPFGSDWETANQKIKVGGSTETQTGGAGGGNLATTQDVGKAMQQAGGDKQKALQILRQQGFTGAQ